MGYIGNMGVSNNNGKTSKSSHFFIGFGTIIFTIHFGYPYFRKHPTFRAITLCRHPAIPPEGRFGAFLGMILGPNAHPKNRYDWMSRVIFEKIIHVHFLLRDSGYLVTGYM